MFSPILVMSADGEVALSIMPHPLDPTAVLINVLYGDVEVPAIPVPVSVIVDALEVWLAKK